MTTTFVDQRGIYYESYFEHRDARPLAIRFRIFPNTGLRGLASQAIIYHKQDTAADINIIGSANDLFFINRGRIYLNAPTPDLLELKITQLIHEVDKNLQLLIPNARLTYGKMAGFSLHAFANFYGLMFTPTDQQYIDLASKAANRTYAALNELRQRQQLNTHNGVHIRRHGSDVTRYYLLQEDGFTPTPTLGRQWVAEIIRAAKLQQQQY